MAGSAAPAAASTDGEDWAIALIRRMSAADATIAAPRRRPRPHASGWHRLSGHALARHSPPQALSERRKVQRPDQRLSAAGMAHAAAPALSRGAAHGATHRVMQGAAFSGPAARGEIGRRRGAELPGTMLASLGRAFMEWVPNPPPSLSGAPIRWVASADCLAGALRSVLVDLAASFGPLVVNSTCRSRRHNAQVGGAKRSFHLTGNAVDFRVAGNPRPVLAFLRARGDVGGLKHYGGGVFHVDTGPRRTW